MPLAVLSAREVVRRTRFVPSKVAEEDVSVGVGVPVPTTDVSIVGGVEGGDEPDEDGALSRSIASGSNAERGSSLLLSIMSDDEVVAVVDVGAAVVVMVVGRVGPRLGESRTTTWTSSKCSRSAWRSGRSIPQHE